MSPLVILFLLGTAQPPQQNCPELKYDEVTINGILRRCTFPGPNNEHFALDGDLDTYFLLEPLSEICIKDLPDNVTGAVQLVFIGNAPEMYKKLRPFLGTAITCTGTLWEAVTGHHHTSVLLHVTSCAVSNQS